MKIWKGPVECAVCNAVHNAQIEIEDEQAEPYVALECDKCGSLACSPHIPSGDDDEHR